MLYGIFVCDGILKLSHVNWFWKYFNNKWVLDFHKWTMWWHLNYIIIVGKKFKEENYTWFRKIILIYTGWLMKTGIMWTFHKLQNSSTNRKIDYVNWKFETRIWYKFFSLGSLEGKLFENEVERLRRNYASLSKYSWY